MRTTRTTAVAGLPELLRPRFFPGQLLTDRDLSDLVSWVESRLRLERLREGWGVVCGLAVTAERPRQGHCCGRRSRSRWSGWRTWLPAAARPSRRAVRS